MTFPPTTNNGPAFYTDAHGLLVGKLELLYEEMSRHNRMISIITESRRVLAQAVPTTAGDVPDKLTPFSAFKEEWKCHEQEKAILTSTDRDIEVSLAELCEHSKMILRMIELSQYPPLNPKARVFITDGSDVFCELTKEIRF